MATPILPDVTGLLFWAFCDFAVMIPQLKAFSLKTGLFSHVPAYKSPFLNNTSL